jgi:plastocyanin
VNPFRFPARSSSTAAVALAVALTVACGDDEEPDYSGDATSGAARPVELTANDFSFTPAELTAGRGDSFEISLTNAGNAPHTFTINEFDIDAQVAAGEETTISVSPTQTGKFSYYCRFHKEQGMEGDITISGAGGAADPGPTKSPAEDPFYDY